MDQKNTTISRNSITYSEELKWLVSIVNTRLEKHFSNESFVIDSIEAPIYAKNDSVYADWVLKHKLNTFERLIVISSLSCIFSSHVFDTTRVFEGVAVAQVLYHHLFVVALYRSTAG